MSDLHWGQSIRRDKFLAVGADEFVETFRQRARATWTLTTPEPGWSVQWAAFQTTTKKIYQEARALILGAFPPAVNRSLPGGGMVTSRKAESSERLGFWTYIPLDEDDVPWRGVEPCLGGGAVADDFKDAPQAWLDMLPFPEL